MALFLQQSREEGAALHDANSSSPPHPTPRRLPEPVLGELHLQRDLTAIFQGWAGGWGKMGSQGFVALIMWPSESA